MENEDELYNKIEATYTRILLNNDSPDKDFIEKLVKRIDPSIKLNDYSVPVDVFNNLLSMGYAKIITPENSISEIGNIINSLFERSGIALRIAAENFTKMDNEIIKKRRAEKKTTKIYDLNTIDHFLFNIGFEMIEIYIYNKQKQILINQFLIMTKREK